MAKSANAEWVGVLVVGPYELDCRLFAATGWAKPFPLKDVHADCRTTLDVPKQRREEPSNGDEAPSGTTDEPTATETREQLYCPKCQRALKADEVSKAAETDAGLITLTETDVASLSFAPVKRAVTEFALLDDSALAATGVDRRFWVFPKPAALETYAKVWTLLIEARLVALVPLLVLKRKPYIGVLRPLILPADFFGEERRLLVLDTLMDTDRLKDPARFPDYPRGFPILGMGTMAQPIADAQASLRPFDPSRCINPLRMRLKGLVKAALERAVR